MFDNKLTLPVLVLGTTLLLMTAFQMRQLMMENDLVKTAIGQQDQLLAQAEKVTKQFENLAVGTARLASDGNETARNIMNDFTKLGLKVNVNAEAGKSPIERIQPQSSQQQSSQPKLDAPAAQTTTPSAPAAEPAAPAVGN